MLKIGAISPHIKLANPSYNADIIIKSAKKAKSAGCNIALFSKFPITGSSIFNEKAGGSLMNSSLITDESLKAFNKILKASENIKDLVLVLSLPTEINGRLSVCNKVILNGEVIGENIGSDLEFSFAGIEYVVSQKSPKKLQSLYKSKAILLQNEVAYTAGIRDIEKIKAKYKYKNNIFISVSTGPEESGDDCLYSGLKCFAVDGCLIDSVINLKNDLSIFKIAESYNKTLSFYNREIDSAMNLCNIDEYFDVKNPFIPVDYYMLENYCLDILRIQALSIGKRLEHINSKDLVLGVSGGLDSTLALVASVLAFDYKGWDKNRIHCITMPGFGTGNLTKTNAFKLTSALGLDLKEIPIEPIVTSHLESINQPRLENGDFKIDITYENAQARMRTLILMDYSNKVNGIVLGTGDMSELALGWCTYNGDHMSMYSINSGVPKTLISHILNTYLKRVVDSDKLTDLSYILQSIIDTPISPELLPTDKNGNIAQLTEDSVGPYALHDFFLFTLICKGLSPLDTYKKAILIFENDFDKYEIKKWLKTFIWRFFSQQFKRSCLPLGPKVLKFSLSPRAGFCMPSDADCSIWLSNLDSGDF